MAVFSFCYTHLGIYFLLFFILKFISFSDSRVALIGLMILVSLVPFSFEFFNIKTTHYTRFHSKEIYEHVFFHYGVFVLIFLSTIRNIKFDINTERKAKSGGFDRYVLILFMLIILLFGKTGDNILTSTYGDFNTTGLFGLSINEYYLMFLVIYAVFFRLSFLVHSITFFFVLKNLAFGGRIELLQIAIFYMVYYNIKWTRPTAIFGILIGVVFLEVWGTIRTYGMSFDIISLVLSSNLVNLDFLLASVSTFSEVIYSSAVIEASVDLFFSINERFGASINHLKSFIMPYSLLDTSANIALSVQSFSPAGGGGLISSYLYFIGGTWGIIIGASFYGLLLRRAMRSKSKIMSAVVIVMISTVPRWLLYNHVTFFKFGFYTFLVALFFNHLRRYGANYKQ